MSCKACPIAIYTLPAIEVNCLTKNLDTLVYIALDQYCGISFCLLVLLG